jgi:hypothetical protein
MGTCVNIGGAVDRSRAFVAAPLQTDEKLLQTLAAAAAASSAPSSAPSSSLISKALPTTASTPRPPPPPSPRTTGHGILRFWDGIGNGLVDAAEALQLHLGSTVPPCPEVFRFLCRNYSIAAPTLVDAAASNAVAAQEAGLPIIAALWQLLSCLFTKEQYAQLIRHTQATARKAAGTPSILLFYNYVSAIFVYVSARVETPLLQPQPPPPPPPSEMNTRFPRHLLPLKTPTQSTALCIPLMPSLTTGAPLVCFTSPPPFAAVISHRFFLALQRWRLSVHSRAATEPGVFMRCSSSPVVPPVFVRIYSTILFTFRRLLSHLSIVSFSARRPRSPDHAPSLQVFLSPHDLASQSVHKRLSHHAQTYARIPPISPRTIQRWRHANCSAHRARPGRRWSPRVQNRRARGHVSAAGVSCPLPCRASCALMPRHTLTCWSISHALNMYVDRCRQLGFECEAARILKTCGYPLLNDKTQVGLPASRLIPLLRR